MQTQPPRSKMTKNRQDVLGLSATFLADQARLFPDDVELFDY